MINENKYDRVRDIYSIPCARRINGEKCIVVQKHFAFVQYVDGMSTYWRANDHDVWQRVKTEVFCNA